MEADRLQSGAAASSSSVNGSSLPFRGSRLRSYEGRLQAQTDRRVGVGNAMALNAASTAAKLLNLPAAAQDPQLSAAAEAVASLEPPVMRSGAGDVGSSGGTSSSGNIAAIHGVPNLSIPAATVAVMAPTLSSRSRPSNLSMSGSPRASSLAVQEPGSSTVPWTAAVAELSALRSDIAGVENILNALKGPLPTTAMGRSSPTPGVKRTNRRNGLPGHNRRAQSTEQQRLSRSHDGFDVELNFLTNPGESALGRPVAVAKVNRHHTTRPPAAEASFDQLRDGPGSSMLGGAVAPEDRWRARAGTNPVAGALLATLDAEHHAADDVDVASIDTLLQEPLEVFTRAWKPRHGPVPVGREEAVALEDAVEKLLPAGAISSKHQLATLGLNGLTATARANDDLRADFEALDGLLSEAAQQVSSACAQRGRAVDKIRERYAEIFSALSHMAFNLTHATARQQQLLATAASQQRKQERTITTLERQLGTSAGLIGELRGELDACQARYQELEGNVEERERRLMRQVEALLAERDSLAMQQEALQEEWDRWQEETVARHEGELLVAGDEREDLLQRLHFAQRQLQLLRREGNRMLPSEHKEVQTEPPQDDAEAAGPVEAAPQDVLQAPKAKKKKKRKMQDVGIFGDLLNSHAHGRVRPRGWMLRTIAQLYLDKVTADAVDDREGRTRATVGEFVLAWHLNRYGLRSLAEDNLLDLISSVKHHSQGSAKARDFGYFCGLLPDGNSRGSLQHLNFYLFTLQQLAYPANITSVFVAAGDAAGDDDASGLVPLKSGLVLEALRAVFRYLDDPDAGATFVAKRLESASIPDQPGMVDCDKLLDMLMEEFQRRVLRNMSHLKALYRASVVGEGRAMSSEEFAAAFKLADSSMSNQAVARIYADAVAKTKDATGLDLDAFVTVARDNGLDRWRIELKISGSLGTSPSPGVGGTSLDKGRYGRTSANSRQPRAGGAAARPASRTQSRAAQLGDQLPQLSQPPPRQQSGGGELAPATEPSSPAPIASQLSIRPYGSLSASLAVDTGPNAATSMAPVLEASSSISVGAGGEASSDDLQRQQSRASGGAANTAFAKHVRPSSAGVNEDDTPRQAGSAVIPPTPSQPGPTRHSGAAAAAQELQPAGSSIVVPLPATPRDPGDGVPSTPAAAGSTGPDPLAGLRGRMLGMLDSALASMYPPLEEQVALGVERLHDLGRPSQRLSDLHAHFMRKYEERTDMAAAWLAFRLLLAQLEAVARPGLKSAKSNAAGLLGEPSTPQGGNLMHHQQQHSSSGYLPLSSPAPGNAVGRDSSPVIIWSQSASPVPVTLQPAPLKPRPLTLQQPPMSMSQPLTSPTSPSARLALPRSPSTLSACSNGSSRLAQRASNDGKAAAVGDQPQMVTSSSSYGHRPATADTSAQPLGSSRRLRPRPMSAQPSLAAYGLKSVTVQPPNEHGQ